MGLMLNWGGMTWRYLSGMKTCREKRKKRKELKGKNWIDKQGAYIIIYRPGGLYFRPFRKPGRLYRLPFRILKPDFQPLTVRLSLKNLPKLLKIKA